MVDDFKRVREALQALLADPHGCPMCDSGKLRKTADARGADHWSECAYLKARTVLDAAVQQPLAPKSN